MLTIKPKETLNYLLIVVCTIIISYILTLRYFPIEPDVANSPIVWRAFLSEGFSAFKDWSPTSDNWYFTTFPVNFVFFILLSDDGKLPLIASASTFVILTPMIILAVINSTKKSWSSIFAPLCLILLPAYVYVYGFIAHPFSHYSTNFFGVLVFALSFYNMRRNSFFLAMICSILSLLAAVSDPWFLATYFLPLLLVHMFFSWKKVISKKITILFLIVFVIAMTHAVSRLLGLPVQHFKLVPLEQWMVNAKWSVHVFGKSLNLFLLIVQSHMLLHSLYG